MASLSVQCVALRFINISKLRFLKRLIPPLRERARFTHEHRNKSTLLYIYIHTYLPALSACPLLASLFGRPRQSAAALLSSDLSATFRKVPLHDGLQMNAVPCFHHSSELNSEELLAFRNKQLANLKAFHRIFYGCMAVVFAYKVAIEFSNNRQAETETLVPYLLLIVASALLILMPDRVSLLRELICVVYNTAFVSFIIGSFVARSAADDGANVQPIQMENLYLVFLGGLFLHYSTGYLRLYCRIICQVTYIVIPPCLLAKRSENIQNIVLCVLAVNFIIFYNYSQELPKIHDYARYIKVHEEKKSLDILWETFPLSIIKARFSPDGNGFEHIRSNDMAAHQIHIKDQETFEDALANQILTCKTKSPVKVNPNQDEQSRFSQDNSTDRNPAQTGGSGKKKADTTLRERLAALLKAYRKQVQRKGRECRHSTSTMNQCGAKSAYTLSRFDSAIVLKQAEDPAAHGEQKKLFMNVNILNCRVNGDYIQQLVYYSQQDVIGTRQQQDQDFEILSYVTDKYIKKIALGMLRIFVNQQITVPPAFAGNAPRAQGDDPEQQQQRSLNLNNYLLRRVWLDANILRQFLRHDEFEVNKFDINYMISVIKELMEAFDSKTREAMQDQERSDESVQFNAILPQLFVRQDENKLFLILYCLIENAYQYSMDYTMVETETQFLETQRLVEVRISNYVQQTDNQYNFEKLISGFDRYMNFEQIQQQTYNNTSDHYQLGIYLANKYIAQIGVARSFHYFFDEENSKLTIRFKIHSDIFDMGYQEEMLRQTQGSVLELWADTPFNNNQQFLKQVEQKLIEYQLGQERAQQQEGLEQIHADEAAGANDNFEHILPESLRQSVEPQPQH